MSVNIIIKVVEHVDCVDAQTEAVCVQKNGHFPTMCVLSSAFRPFIRQTVVSLNGVVCVNVVLRGVFNNLCL